MGNEECRVGMDGNRLHGYHGRMNSEPLPTAAERKPDPATPKTATALPATIAAYEACLLAMARAVEYVGMYGLTHSTAQERVNDWFSLLAPLIRSRGGFSLHSNGSTVLVNDTALPRVTANPVILVLLRKLYTTRAGKIELRSGFNASNAGLLAEFLANANATCLADDEHSLGEWVKRNRLHHVSVTPLQIVEVKEGERVVSGERRRRVATQPSPVEPLKPEAIAAWLSAFKEDADRANRDAAMPRKVLGLLAAFLRGTAEASPAGMAECMTRAAGDAARLSEVILKSALVQHELAHRAAGPVGDEVVACLRAVVNALQETNEARTEEGWRAVAQTLASLETCILERLEALAGGTEQDAEAIRAGVRALHHEIEGAALKREYERKRNALTEVERRIREFFGLDARQAPDDPAGPAP